MSDELGAKGTATRSQLLEIAVERFGRDGLQRTSIADIARDANLARSAPYAYFENKDDLFSAALDHDAAGTVLAVVPTLFGDGAGDAADWPRRLVSALLAALDDHPLARRVLAGLEPTVTGRFMDLPALVQLRQVVVDRLTEQQAGGNIRADIDVAAVGPGIVTTVLALLMAIVQLGPDTIDDTVLDEVGAVLDATLRPSS